MSKNSPASIFGGFSQNEFEELVRKISKGEPIYQKEPSKKKVDNDYVKEISNA